MKPIAFLGIGQFGGNIADIADKHGYYTGAINLCKEDLNSLKNVKAKLHLNGSFGAGKDRSEAIEKIKDNFDNAVEWIKNRFSDPGIEIIYVVFSTGGGSGSGIGPITVDVMSEIMPDKKWGAIIALPFSYEGLSANANTIKCFEELSQIENLASVFIIDNEKVSAMNNNLSRKDVFDITNNEIIALFDLVLNYTKRTSSLGNFDKKDLIQLLSTRGNALITTIGFSKDLYKDKDIDLQEYIYQQTDDSIINNIFANLEFDNNILRAGVIYEFRDIGFNPVSSQIILRQVGSPIDLFEGYYETNNNRITTILTGLSFPFTTLNKIDEAVSIEQQKIESTVLSKYNQSFKGKSTEFINILQKTKQKSKTTVQQNNNIEKPSMSLKDKLAKYK